MKKIFNITLAVIVLGLASCTDLDIQPKSSTTNNIVFEDPASYRAFIAKVYAGFAVSGQQGPAGDADIKGIDEGFSNYLRQYWKAQELTTDEAVIAWGDEGLQDYHSHIWTASNQFVTAMFNRIFYQVSIANEFLRESTEDKLNERGINENLKAEIRAYRAEARFIRALVYWHGIDLFGNVPFYKEDKALGKDAPAQGNRAEIFSFIESELSAIENDMVAPGQNEYGRADRAALWMLQAKLYLNAEIYTGTSRYSDVVTATEKIINSGAFTIQNDYQHLFMTDNHSSDEIIFSIPFDGNSTQTWGGMTFLVHAGIGGDMDPALYGVNGGWFGIRTTSAVVNLFPDETGNADSRAIFHTSGQSKEINTISSFNDGYAAPKFTNVASDGTPGVDLNFPDTDYPMFRLADAYLMYAEASLRGGGGNTSLAVDLVNQLRERAYGDDTKGQINLADLTLEFILDERARELYWEGHRRTDLIRYNLFTDNGVWPWKGGVKEGKTTSSHMNVFPIPSSEILANPQLTQNVGY